MRLNGLLLTFLFAFTALFQVVGCSNAEDFDNSKQVVITMDSGNQLFIDGERSQLSKLQALVEDNRGQYELNFTLMVNEETCIGRINDITRIIHPDPVNFASAD